MYKQYLFALSLFVLLVQGCALSNERPAETQWVPTPGPLLDFRSYTPPPKCPAQTVDGELVQFEANTAYYVFMPGLKRWEHIRTKEDCTIQVDAIFDISAEESDLRKRQATQACMNQQTADFRQWELYEPYGFFCSAFPLPTTIDTPKIGDVVSIWNSFEGYSYANYTGVKTADPSVTAIYPGEIGTVQSIDDMYFYIYVLSEDFTFPFLKSEIKLGIP